MSLYAACCISWQYRDKRRPAVTTMPYSYGMINPLSPHDALKHHFKFLKTYLILQQLIPWKFHETGLPIHDNFFNFFIFIYYKSRIATAIRGL